jgi:site-specific DNA-methyltransferase (adenine-specific)
VQAHTLNPVLETSNGQLFEGDCVEILARLDAESVDLAFADPPFNLAKIYASKINDNLSDVDYLHWCRKWLKELVRTLKPGGSLFLYNLPKWNLPLGAELMGTMTFRNWITVDMKYSLPIPGRLYPSNYSLLYFVKGKKPAIFHPDRLPIECCRHCGGEVKDYGGYKNKMNPEGVNLSDVWTDIPPVRHSKYKKRQANGLALKLMDRILSLASNEGSVVLDPFGGSGTTYVAAELLGRRWIGIELDCQSIVDRFARITEDKNHLTEIHAAKNRLFTIQSMNLRAKNKISSDKYRLSEEKLTPVEPALF